MKGRLILPGDPGYDDARRIWNAMIDRRPAVILQCAEAADVPHAVSFSRDHELAISIRGAGHNIAGNAVCDNGMMIDFSGMRTVRVDVENRRAQVEPGATLNDVDRATQRHGLAIPLGINSTTGIAGLTRGGGFGWYWKSHNLTDISDGALDAILQFAGRLPTAQCEIFLGWIAGAANRIPADATAYAHRGTKFVLNVHGRWDDPADDGRCTAWARDFFKASAPYASAGAYVNFMTEDETDRIAAAYGSSYARLVQIKRRYDPENIFHLNQNIKP